jgi:hypothetical protein
VVRMPNHVGRSFPSTGRMNVRRRARPIAEKGWSPKQLPGQSQWSQDAAEVMFCSKRFSPARIDAE